MDKQYPEPVVGCFILNDKKEILLVKSYKWPGKWVVSGGHIEWGESISQAAVREAKEELGLDVEFVKIIKVREFVFEKSFYKTTHFVAMQSWCKLVGSAQPKIDNDEIQEARWFAFEDAVKIPDLLDITKETIVSLMEEYEQK